MRLEDSVSSRKEAVLQSREERRLSSWIVTVEQKEDNRGERYYGTESQDLALCR